jgi:energy-converting hydrogenase B subunit D
MNVVIIVALALVAASATTVVATTEPGRQAVTLSGFGLALALLFMALQAPDVSLSEIGVNTAIVPLMVMLAVRKTHQQGSHEAAKPDEAADRS